VKDRSLSNERSFAAAQDDMAFALDILTSVGDFCPGGGKNHRPEKKSTMLPQAINAFS
jgi:hypothetical protein